MHRRLEAIDPDFVFHLASSTLKPGASTTSIDGDGGRERVVLPRCRGKKKVSWWPPVSKSRAAVPS